MPMHMRRAFHEAGHAYAAYHYNVGIEHVSLSAPATEAFPRGFSEWRVTAALRQVFLPIS